jgi:hypothetical protein
MQSVKRYRLAFEQLEERLVPTFNAVYSSATSTWTITQTVNNGDLTVILNAGNPVNSQMQVIEGANTVNLGNASSNLTVNMTTSAGNPASPTNGNLTVQLDTAITGNLSVNLGTGSRNLNLTGASNSLAGNLTVNAGTGSDSLSLAVNARLNVGGSANITMGFGDDVLVDNATAAAGAGPGMTIGGNMSLYGINRFSHRGDLIVGGNFTQNLTFKSTPVTLMGVISSGGNGYGLLAGGPTVVGGSFTYLGGPGVDQVYLIDGATIGKNIYVNLGANIDPQNFFQGLVLDNNHVILAGEVAMGNQPVTVGGNVTMIGGMDPVSSNVFATDTATTIAGNIYLNFASEGAAGGAPFAGGFVNLFGNLGGSAITIIGGAFRDQVQYDANGSQARLTAQLGAGNDTFTLGQDPAVPQDPPYGGLASLYIDFGPGVDTFSNFTGAAQPPMTLKNLP